MSKLNSFLKLNPAKWNGYMVLLEFGEWAGVGIIGAALVSDTDVENGGYSDKDKGVYIIVMGGIILPQKEITSYVSKVHFESPGIYGPNPLVLCGPVGFASVTVSIGIGVSYNKVFKMGYGKGKGWERVFGYGEGFDAMRGVSLPGSIDYDRAISNIENHDYGSGGGGAGRWF